MNGLASAGASADRPCAARALLRTAPHADAAGDQITGFGALTCPSGQSSTSNCSAWPDDTLLTATPKQVPPIFACFDELNDLARSLNRAIFSGDEATSTRVQPPGTSPPPLVVVLEVVQPAVRTAAAMAMMILARRRTLSS